MIISLSKFNGTGTSASIKNWESESCAVFEDDSELDPIEACKRAAENLRKLADRFDKLAKEPEPFKSKTQDKINQ